MPVVVGVGVDDGLPGTRRVPARNEPDSRGA